MSFGQVVIGPPGSGKSTYCHGMQQFLTALGRPVAVVNLDPANDALPYRCDVDISELISLSDVMDELQLGPNGGLIYCMEYIETNIAWLHERLKPLETDNRYIIFDLPGQVELFTHHRSIQRILTALQKKNYRLTCVHLVDIIHCTEPSQFVSVLLLSLCAQLHLELPHVNVLSKIDLLSRIGPLQFGLEFYTEVMDLDYLLDHLNASTSGGVNGTESRFLALNAAICSLVQDFGCTSFVPVAIEDRHSVHAALKQIDKANGYAFSGLDSVYAQRAVKAESERKNAAFASAVAAARNSNRSNSATSPPAIPITLPAAGSGNGSSQPTADELKAAAAHPLFTAVSVDTDFDYFRTGAVMSDEYATSTAITEHEPDTEPDAESERRMSDSKQTAPAPLSARPPPARSSEWGKRTTKQPADTATAAPTHKPPPKSKSAAFRYCANCSKREQRMAEFKKCSRCRAVHYCSADCQSANWALHKPDCTPPVSK